MNERLTGQVRWWSGGGGCGGGISSGRRRMTAANAKAEKHGHPQEDEQPGNRSRHQHKRTHPEDSPELVS